MTPTNSVYLAGPMRGRPFFNFPAFDAAEAFLASLGMSVVNPAKHDREIYPGMAEWPGFESGDLAKCPEFSVGQAIMWDLQQVAECRSIAVLPGWQGSEGANLEVSLARMLGHDILDATTGGPWTENILQEAERVVSGSRGWDYGSPAENHGCTATYWSTYLSRRLRVNANLDARDVCWLNILQKISRDQFRPKRDNLVDAAGYARNIELL